MTREQTTPMRIGLVLMLSDRTISVIEAALALEERGFESLWVGEHTHLPVDTVHSYTRGRYGTGKVTRGGYVPDFYKRSPDPYVTLTAAAVSTKRLRIGTCIALPAEHNPLVLAKAITTLDDLSGGRFEFGIGYGWNPLEMANNGFAYDDRRYVLGEKISAMRRLWTQDTASADGRFVRFTESWSYPKPVQKPHPPVLIGAAPTAGNLADLAGWADGWLPVRSFLSDHFADDVKKVRDAVAKAGRDPDGFQITLVDPRGSMGGKRSRESFVKHLAAPAMVDECVRLGLYRLNLAVPTEDRDLFLWAVDQVARLREEVLG